MADKKAKALIKSLHAYGKANGQRITAPREYVLEIIASSKKPITAYDILDVLGEKLDKPKPPTAYRALEFLLAHGFIHRIESMNAYIACGEDHKHKGSQFMICKQCGWVDEIHLCSIPDALKQKTNEKGFTLSHWNAELYGLCQNCTA